MNSQTLKKIVEQVRRDPKLFHALVFSPEQALSHFDFIDEQTKQRLAGMDPEQLVSSLFTPSGGSIGTELHCNPTCGGDGTCSHTCSGGGSCGYTCQAPSCGVTCKVRSCSTTGYAPSSGGAEF